MKTFFRNILDDLRALSWRLPFVRKPRQLGSFVRYAGKHTEDEVNYLSQSVAERLARSAWLGGLTLANGKEIRHYPRIPSDDPYDQLGSVGWKADVR